MYNKLCVMGINLTPLLKSKLSGVTLQSHDNLIDIHKSLWHMDLCILIYTRMVQFLYIIPLALRNQRSTFAKCGVMYIEKFIHSFD